MFFSLRWYYHVGMFYKKRSTFWLNIALTPLIIWKLQSTTCPRNRRDIPKTDPYIHTRANHTPFHFHFFSSSSSLTPPIPYTRSVVRTRGEQAQPRAAPRGTSPLGDPPVRAEHGPHHAQHRAAPCPGAPGTADAPNHCCWRTESDRLGETALPPFEGTTPSGYGLDSHRRPKFERALHASHQRSVHQRVWQVCNTPCCMA